MSVATTSAATPDTEWVVVTDQTAIPAARAAATPAGASSMTRQSPGSTPSADAAARYGSGNGLPRSVRSEVMSTGGGANPAAANRAAASGGEQDVTIASGDTVASSSAAPGSGDPPVAACSRSTRSASATASS